MSEYEYDEMVRDSANGIATPIDHYEDRGHWLETPVGPVEAFTQAEQRWTACPIIQGPIITQFDQPSLSIAPWATRPWETASPPVPATVDQYAQRVFDNHTQKMIDATDRALGFGGAPTRATSLPSDPTARKQHPIASGVLDYFPDALVAIANVSWAGTEQHNPGKPLHWDRSKSSDEADTMLRHFLERGSLDTDGKRHSAKMAWRALAILQKEIEAERA